MIAWLDASSGISGDKFLGALMDARVELADIQAALDAVLPGEGAVSVEPVVRRGIAGLHVTVAETRTQPARTWAQIRSLLEGAALPAGVRDRALAVFAALAEAEASVHGVATDAVHFHEVGAVDSIADIVGVCAGLAALGVEELVCSPVAVGSGTVETAHGTLPVPAPATARLLVGVPVTAGGSEGELTTPTGAALVAALADRFGPVPDMTLHAVGHGAGTRDTAVANVARLMVGEATGDGDRLRTSVGETGSDGTAPLAADTVSQLRTVIDHVTAEHLAFALERVLEAGAIDAWLTPVVMKKGRPGHEVTVLAAPCDTARIAAELVRHTGTLGVRVETLERLIAPREESVVQTALGPVRVKRGPGPVLRAEYEELARIARERDLTLAEVAALVDDAANAAAAGGAGGDEPSA